MVWSAAIREMSLQDRKNWNVSVVDKLLWRSQWKTCIGHTFPDSKNWEASRVKGKQQVLEQRVRSYPDGCKSYDSTISQSVEHVQPRSQRNKNNTHWKEAYPNVANGWNSLQNEGKKKTEKKCEKNQGQIFQTQGREPEALVEGASGWGKYAWCRTPRPNVPAVLGLRATTAQRSYFLSSNRDSRKFWIENLSRAVLTAWSRQRSVRAYNSASTRW